MTFCVRGVEECDNFQKQYWFKFNIFYIVPEENISISIKKTCFEKMEKRILLRKTK